MRSFKSIGLIISRLVPALTKTVVLLFRMCWCLQLHQQNDVILQFVHLCIHVAALVVWCTGPDGLQGRFQQRWRGGHIPSEGVGTIVSSGKDHLQITDANCLTASSVEQSYWSSLKGFSVAYGPKR